MERMKTSNKYKRLERCSKEELIEKIIVRDKHCDDLKGLLDKGLKKYKELEEKNKKLEADIKKREDRWMVKLAEIYVMPTKHLTTAIAKNEWYSSRYDTIKRKMLHELGFDRLDVQDLLKENKKLKEKLEQIKEAYVRFEKSEKEYNKGLGELDQLIMNR